MTDVADEQIDHDTKGYRYFRNAVDRHWDPYEIPLERDKLNLIEFDHQEGETDFDNFRRGLALFGAGEESVTEDLAPLAVALTDIEDEMFVTTQMYEEAKHAEFFDRYWQEVINPVEEERGYEVTTPLLDRFFMPDYVELFEKNEEAMHRLLTDDTPENRVRAYTHYHLVIEGILAQTGYYGFHHNFSGEVQELPHLPGLVEGFANIRSDEGRHVGFGMAKIKEHLRDDAVSPDVLHETLGDLIPLTQGIVFESSQPDREGVGQEELTEYASEKHQERMQQITSGAEDIPDVDDLVRVADD